MFRWLQGFSVNNLVFAHAKGSISCFEFALIAKAI